MGADGAVVCAAKVVLINAELAWLDGRVVLTMATFEPADCAVLVADAFVTNAVAPSHVATAAPAMLTASAPRNRDASEEKKLFESFLVRENIIVFTRYFKVANAEKRLEERLNTAYSWLLILLKQCANPTFEHTAGQLVLQQLALVVAMMQTTIGRYLQVFCVLKAS